MEIEIAENTLVAVIDGEFNGQFGWVREKLSDERFLVRIIKNDNTIMERTINKNDVVPIASDCTMLDTPNISLQMHMPKVTMNIIRMIVDLQKQVKALQSHVYRVLDMELNATQKHLSELEAGQHHY